jgi:hypothetical protein
LHCWALATPVAESVLIKNGVLPETSRNMPARQRFAKSQRASRYREPLTAMLLHAYRRHQVLLNTPAPFCPEVSAHLFVVLMRWRENHPVPASPFPEGSLQ